MHFTRHDFAKQAFTILRAERNEIRACLRVLISFQAN
jgi:hypothetical protein